LGDTLVVVSAVVVVDPGARTQAVTVPGADDQMNMFPDCPSRSRDGASIVAKPEDGDVVVVAVYLKVVVPVAPFESKAVIVYVPVTQEADPPTAVEYENVPPAPTATVAASTGLGEPPSVTVMTTLSGSVGVGVIVPLIVYAVVPE
jgi:hypothetical protein